MSIHAVTRRRLLATLAASVPAGLLPARPARAAQGPARLGLVVPKGGAAAEQARLGAEVGLREGATFAELFGKALALLVEEATTPAEASRKGADLVRKGGVAALVGGLDDESAVALRDVAAREPALFLNIGSRADDLRGAGCHRRVFHVQASDAMYADVLVQWLAAQRKVKRWALVAADGPRERALRAAAAAAVAAAGGQVAADEPLGVVKGEAAAQALGRAQKAGAEVAYLALPSGAQLEVVRAARQVGLALPLAGPGLEPGDFLSRDLVGASGLWSALWYHQTTRFSARELNRRFREETRQPMQGIAWAAWAAVRLLAEAAVRAEEATAAAWGAFLASDYPFDGHKGEQLTFRPWDQQLRLTFTVLSPRRPDAFAAEPDVYEVLSDNQPRDLDAIGTREGQSRCRLGA